MAYKSIVVGYSLSREDSAESISLPTVGGYTYQSSISSDYSKVISIDASVGKTAAEIAGEYVRAIVFNGGRAGQQIKVTLSTEEIKYKTFFWEGNGHYYLCGDGEHHSGQQRGLHALLHRGGQHL